MSSNILKFTGQPVLLFNNQALPAPPATVSSPIASGFKGIKAVTLFLEWSDGGGLISLPNFQYTFSEFNSTTGNDELYLGMAPTNLTLPNSDVIPFEQDIQVISFGLDPIFVCWEVLKPAAADNFSCTVLEVGDPAMPGTIDSLFVKGSVY